MHAPIWPKTGSNQALLGHVRCNLTPAVRCNAVYGSDVPIPEITLMLAGHQEITQREVLTCRRLEAPFGILYATRMRERLCHLVSSFTLP